MKTTSVNMDIMHDGFLQGNNIYIQSLYLPAAAEQGIEVEMLRIDRLDKIISGNKWFKLKYNLQDARLNDHNTVLSFGGAYSNHLSAMAEAAKRFGFKSVGVI